jgi:hypothetical protein
MLVDIDSIVLAMWDEPHEEITREVMARFDISYDQAYELVLQAIVEEINRDGLEEELPISYGEFSDISKELDFDSDC